MDRFRLERLVASSPLEPPTTWCAVDASVWPRCDAETSPERGFSHHPSRHAQGSRSWLGGTPHGSCRCRCGAPVGPLLCACAAASLARTRISSRPSRFARGWSRRHLAPCCPSSPLTQALSRSSSATLWPTSRWACSSVYAPAAVAPPIPPPNPQRGDRGGMAPHSSATRPRPGRRRRPVDDDGSTVRPGQPARVGRPPCRATAARHAGQPPAAPARAWDADPPRSRAPPAPDQTAATTVVLVVWALDPGPWAHPS